MIGLNGSLTRQEANENSDIDFLIISKKNRIWVCRAISVLIMVLTGLKRYENKISGRVCLNLYQTENHLALSTHNKILARNYAYTLPLWQADDIFKRFAQANTWIKKYGKSFLFDDYEPVFWENILMFFATPFRWITELLFDLLFNDWGEQILKSYQVKRIENDPRTKRAKSGEIFLSDRELRFHPHKISDSRPIERLTI